MPPVAYPPAAERGYIILLTKAASPLDSPATFRGLDVIVVPGAFSKCLGEYGRPFDSAIASLS